MTFLSVVHRRRETNGQPAALSRSDTDGFIMRNGWKMSPDLKVTLLTATSVKLLAPHLQLEHFQTDKPVKYYESLRF